MSCVELFSFLEFFLDFLAFFFLLPGAGASDVDARGARAAAPASSASLRRFSPFGGRDPDTKCTDTVSSDVLPPVFLLEATM